MAPTRLRKSREERVLLGVAGGLADYFSVDPVLVRLAFILLAFAGGLGAIAYIALALLMPAALAADASPGQVIRENLRQMPQEVAEAAREMGETLRGAAPPEQEAPAPSPPSRRGQGRGFFGIVLVIAGVLILAANVGLFSWWDWGVWWPVMLIGLGLLVLARRSRGP